MVLLDGDVELGKGVALVHTPGHTDGNHSLVINTPEGVYVSSENGVSADSWQPSLSKIPGVKKYAEFWNREVILNSNTLEDTLDQYDSMVKEKSVADANAQDPALAERLPLLGDGELQAPVAGGAELLARRHEPRPDPEAGRAQRRLAQRRVGLSARSSQPSTSTCSTGVSTATSPRPPARRPAAPAMRRPTSSRARSRPDCTLVSIAASPVWVPALAWLRVAKAGGTGNGRVDRAGACGRAGARRARLRGRAIGFLASRRCDPARDRLRGGGGLWQRAPGRLWRGPRHDGARLRPQRHLRAAHAQLPVDFRRCRQTACSNGSDRPAEINESDSGLPVTAFTQVVDRRRDGGSLYLQYWLYFPESFSGGIGRKVELFGGKWPGAHADDWEGYQVKISPNGDLAARTTAHGGYTNFGSSAGWGRWTGWYRVSGGSHAGQLVDDSRGRAHHSGVGAAPRSARVHERHRPLPLRHHATVGEVRLHGSRVGLFLSGGISRRRG